MKYRREDLPDGTVVMVRGIVSGTSSDKDGCVERIRVTSELGFFWISIADIVAVEAPEGAAKQGKEPT